MSTRYFALIFGIVYLILGILGLIPGLLAPVATPGNPPTTLTVLYGALFGLFVVNIIHTLVHLIVGIWGILAYRTFTAARSFSIAAGIIFLVLFVFGLIPGLQTIFGIVPLQGADVWLHLISGVIALFFGLVVARNAPVEEVVTTDDVNPGPGPGGPVV